MARKTKKKPIEFEPNYAALAINAKQTSGLLGIVAPFDALPFVGRKKAVKEKDYCLKGGKNYCPYLEACFSKGTYSMNVEMIGNRKYFPKNTIKWEVINKMKRFACTKRVTERESLSYLGGSQY